MRNPAKTALVVLLVTCSVKIGLTQNLDSIQNVLSKNVDDNNIRLFRQLGSMYVNKGLLDSAVYTYKEGLRNSLRLENLYWQTRYTMWIGGVYVNEAKYDSAEKYLEAGLVLTKQIKNDSILAQYYQNKGALYQFQNDNDKALDYLLKAVETMEKMGSKRPMNLLPHAYQDISGIYNNTGMHEKALEYDQKALNLRDDIQNQGELAKFFFNMAVTYNYLHNDLQFKRYLDSAKITNYKGKNQRIESMILAGYGVYFGHKNLLDSALFYYTNAMNLTRSINDMYFFAEKAINTASTLIKLKRYSEASILLDEAAKTSAEFSDYQMLSESYKAKKELALQSGQLLQALDYAEKYKQYSDSFTNSVTKQSIVGLEAKYQSQKKEREIAELVIKNQEKELSVIKKNRLLLLGGILTAALLLLLALLYRYSRQKQLIAKKDKLVHEQQIRFLENQQQLVSMQSMVNGQESERTRIARDLHDGLGGLFSTIKMYFSTLQHDMNHLKENELFQKSITLVGTASSEVRRIAHNMMPEVLMKLGLVNAVKDLCDHTSAGKLLNVKFETHGMNTRLNASTEIMLYRIVQELLNNIIKHAEATNAIIQFIRDENRLSIIIEDNGRGFNSQDAEDQKKAGIETVKSRVNFLNGQLTIDSQSGIGTTIMMDFVIDEVVAAV